MADIYPVTCSPVDCPRAFLLERPDVPGNAVLLVLFAVMIPMCLALGSKYKSLGFAATVTFGLSLEVARYAGRLLLHSQYNNRTDFAIFLIGTTLGPTCICAAIFQIIPRIIALYGDEYRSWRSFWHSFLLYVLIAVSLSLELAGSIVSTVHDDFSTVCTAVDL